jgi:hypothetical protein
MESMQQFAPTTRERMSGLRKDIESGPAQLFNRSMIYSMTKPLAQFHEDYRALDEFVINSSTLEAFSRVSSKSIESDEKTHSDPAYIDGLSQSGGFVIDCNDSTDLDVEVFLNHGWDSFQLYQRIDAPKTYKTYTGMVEGNQTMKTSRLLVLHDNDRIASFKNICLS